MQAIDQNSVVDSMERALVAPPALIDGRTEKDWLCFLTDFASLINFYDSNNMITGNWTPFLAKDPVFLLATISKTPFSKIHSDYTNLCVYLEKLLYPEGKLFDHDRKLVDPVELGKELSQGFNQLFDQVIKIFMCIKRWFYYMKVSVYEYPLKTYVIQQVKSVFSKYFWALLSLRQNLFLSGAINDIKPVDHSQLIFFEPYDEMIWKQDKDKSPYWEILDLENPYSKIHNISFPLKKEHKKNNIAALVFDAVTKAGNELFVFFNNIITQATAGFEILKTQKSKYPDTLLLRTFVDLLKIHQEQLNGITQKHLQFYYKDILKQEELQAVADNVVVCAELAKKNEVFVLPSGTLFDAGLDARKNPVLFSLPNDVTVNPATITRAFTLNRLTGIDGGCRLYLKNIIAPTQLKKDENGCMLTWETFGGKNIQASKPVKPAIAFASPVLLLREGVRYIRLTLTFFNQVCPEWSPGTCYYLSTQQNWLPVIPVVETILQSGDLTIEKQVIININLNATQPPIEPFLINPDGLVSDWPMFKIEFDSVNDPARPPVINSLKIEVYVTGIKSSQLYNDYGALSTKAPFQPFGPTPLLNSNFIVGNNEIFSKPVNNLLMELCWNNVPGNFSDYYQQYNQYLNNYYPVTKPDNTEINTSPPEKETDKREPGIKKAPGPGKRLWNRLVNLFTKKKIPANPQPDGTSIPIAPTPIIQGKDFTNTCFTVKFSILQQQLWNPVKVIKTNPFTCETQPFPPEINQLLWKPYTIYPECPPAIFPENSSLLFSTNGCNSALTSSSHFVCDKSLQGAIPFVPDPNIQLAPLQFTDSSRSGFMKVYLTNPPYGFGSSLYPDVVSYTALQNAWMLSNAQNPNRGPCKKTNKKPSFIQPPKLPFVPKLTEFKAHYSAVQDYCFDTLKDKYPLQCFLYTPFKNYAIYDSSVKTHDYSYIILPANEKALHVSGIPLFHAYALQGYLFLEMENIIPANEVNWFFGLSRKNVTSEETSFVYSYLSTTGWKPLTVLSDSTIGFSCSGIIRVGIPADATNEGQVMPAGKYWCCIAVNSSTDKYSQTAYVNTNGMLAKRLIDASVKAGGPLSLPAGSIKGFKTAVPQISSVIQPFISFGGKAPEQETLMNLRVANRIKTKDRVITAEDYYRLIRQQYNDIYYSKPVFNPLTKIINIYVVKASKCGTDPNAFIPLVDECKILSIQTFLNERASAFSNIKVSNFDLEYVRIYAKVSVKKGFECQEVLDSLNKSLNIYLSPWIPGSQPQIDIDHGISVAEVVAFIKTIKGVLDVEHVSFTTCTIDNQTGKFKITGRIADTQPKMPLTGALFVSFMDHQIKCIAAK